MRTHHGLLVTLQLPRQESLRAPDHLDELRHRHDGPLRRVHVVLVGHLGGPGPLRALGDEQVASRPQVGQGEVHEVHHRSGMAVMGVGEAARQDWKKGRVSEHPVQGVYNSYTQEYTTASRKVNKYRIQPTSSGTITCLIIPAS